MPLVLSSNISADQAGALRVLLAEDWPSQVIFLTGAAGTGKSHVLRLFCKHTRLNHVCLAPTGIAARQVNGTTIHRFFRLKPKPYNADDVDIHRHSPEGRALIEYLDCIVVDEVSMIRADLLDAVDQSLRLNTGSRLPFGGKQLLLVGDLLQLQPVVKEDEREFIDETYSSEFFFDARVLRHVRMTTINLTTLHRQAEDHRFASELQSLRKSDPACLEFLNQRLLLLGQVVESTTTLTATKIRAREINAARLGQLSGTLTTFEGTTTGDFRRDDYPADRTVSLRIGARIMVTKNCPQAPNGTTGLVTGIGNNSVLISCDDGHTIELSKAIWEVRQSRWDPIKRKIESRITGTYEQLPVQLAWALTVHRAQGLTLDAVIVDLGHGAFAAGQSYVAMTRCRRSQDLWLKRRLTRQDLIIHPRLIEIARGINEPGPPDTMAASPGDCGANLKALLCKKVMVNESRIGTLRGVEVMQHSCKATVQLDGESAERVFEVPPTSICRAGPTS